MTELSQKQKELNRKQSEVFLYEYGQEYTDKICADTDALHEKYKDLEIPDSLDTWFYSYKKEQIKKERKRKFQKRIQLVSKRAAIFIIVIIAVTGSLTIGVEAFRLRVFNLFVQESEEYTDLSLIEGGDGNMSFAKPEGLASYFYVTYLPEGFNLIDNYEQEGYNTFYFSDGNNRVSLVSQSGGTEFLSQVDSEEADVTHINIKGHDAIYFAKEEKGMIAWNQDNVLFKISGYVSKEELIKIAESIKKFE
jgi:hypothetical protein